MILGESRGRFKASDIKEYPDRKDCYEATLTITDMISGDSRFYYVTIGNDRGDTRYGIHVRVIRAVSCFRMFIQKWRLMQKKKMSDECDKNKH